MKRKLCFVWLISAVALVGACGKDSNNPTSPSSTAVTGVTAAADGSTLKVNAPTPLSPVNGVKLEQGVPVTLVVGNATPSFGSPSALPLTYKFELYNGSGTKVYTSPNINAGSATTSVTVPGELESDKPYTWQARAENGGNAGPWSARASFVTPQTEGYIRGNELYDPLFNGKTVGNVSGPVQFVPGVGLKLLSEASFVTFNLPQTLIEGEVSALITNVGVISRTEDPKLRIFTMREGDAPINDNEYRMSVDKRGNGAIAWRFLTGPGPYIETVGSERQIYPFHESLTYFVQATWRSGFFNVVFKEGGVNGAVIYDFGKPYRALYTPSPHNVYIGSPYSFGDRGEASSLEDMIIRQFWVSGRPRPDFANK
jgi:hypothetical protein